MFETSLQDQGAHNTLFGASFPDSNTLNSHSSLNSVSDPFFIPTAHKELALSSSFDVNYLLQISQAALSHTASSPCSSVAVVSRELTSVAKGDVLTGMTENQSLVGSSSHNILTSNNSRDSFNYITSVSATPVALPDLAGNTTATARNISVGTSSSTYSDFVGAVDTNDYYRFSLSNTSNFNLTLNGLSGDADVQLLDGTGTTVLQGSYNGGTLAESINRQLAAGNYFIRVSPYGGANTNYNLNVSATPVVPPDLAGNTTATARNITVGSSSNTYSDFVGAVDTNDYYRFSLSNTSNLSVTLNGLSGNADVQLLDSSGTTVLQGSYNAGTLADSINRQLSVGTYYLRVLPTAGVNTNYNLSVSATPVATPAPITDWFSQNLRDSGVLSLTRSLATDGQLSRNDMIAIFRNAEDGNAIDATELTDLRTIVSNATRFNMQDYVRVLSDKIANGSVANQRFGGSTLGNLYAGSSATQMENLISKWFLGSDRPTAASGTTYRYASGSLFQNGISYQDINQGNLGDCYYMTALAGTAFRSPSTIQNMFIDNGDNTYTVRFYNQGVADYVTVDRYLPTNSWGTLNYASRDSGKLYNDSSNELWVALAEKAYVQMNESGWIGRWNNNHTNSYQAIEGGRSEEAVRQITGRNTISDYSLDSNDLNAVLSAFNAGRTVFLSGYADLNNPNNSRHTYTMVGYNASNGQFAIYNPWGQVEYYTWSQMTQGTGGRPAKFFDWSYTTT
jgi:hypothetical protein